ELVERDRPVDVGEAPDLGDRARHHRRRDERIGRVEPDAEAHEGHERPAHARLVRGSRYGDDRSVNGTPWQVAGSSRSMPPSGAGARVPSTADAAETSSTP